MTKYKKKKKNASCGLNPYAAPAVKFQSIKQRDILVLMYWDSDIKQWNSIYTLLISLLYTDKQKNPEYEHNAQNCTLSIFFVIVFSKKMLNMDVSRDVTSHANNHSLFHLQPSAVESIGFVSVSLFLFIHRASWGFWLNI